jgi:hypothetical protein
VKKLVGTTETLKEFDKTSISNTLMGSNVGKSPAALVDVLFIHSKVMAENIA